jgi:hypothetical protein
LRRLRRRRRRSEEADFGLSGKFAADVNSMTSFPGHELFVSIVRVLFANVADEELLFVIPTLKVPACQCCEFLGRRF